jgi:hypothetical protein
VLPRRARHSNRCGNTLRLALPKGVAPLAYLPRARARPASAGISLGRTSRRWPGAKERPPWPAEGRTAWLFSDIAWWTGLVRASIPVLLARSASVGSRGTDAVSKATPACLIILLIVDSREMQGQAPPARGCHASLASVAGFLAPQGARDPRMRADGSPATRRLIGERCKPGFQGQREWEN